MTAQRSYIALFLFRICLFSPILLINSGHGQDAEAGLPFIHNYLPRDYNAAFDNWSIVQDRRGVMYFGNGSGVLEFDGASWRLIKIPNGGAVGCLAMDEAGRIYVAAVSDFGYLAPDSLGRQNFISLQGYFADNHPRFGDVWSVGTASHGVYFKTADQIYRWKDSRIKVWDSVNSYRVYEIDDTIYVRNRGIGLMKLKGDSLVLAPGGEEFANIGIFNMLPFPETSPGSPQKILITTNVLGLYLYDGISFEPFETEADTFLRNNQIYNAAMLADSSFAFATQRGGVVIIDRNGRLIQIIDEFSGLQSQVVYDVFPDRQGGLWLALTKGLARVETPSPFSLFGKNLGIRGIVKSALHFGDRFYITDELGLCAKRKSSATILPDRFMPVPAMDKPGMHLLSVDGKLLAASNGGVFLIQKDGRIEKLTGWAANYLCQSGAYPNRVYVATMDGLFVLVKKGNRWSPGDHITDLKDDISQVLEDGNGDLWLRCRYLGVIRLRSDPGHASGSSSFNFIAERYDYREEISFHVIHLFSINGEIVFATDRGLKRFDAGENRFFPDNHFGSMFADSTRLVLDAVQDSRQRWILLTDSSGHIDIGTMVLQENGQYRWRADHRLNRLDLTNIFNIYPEKKPHRNNDVLWISVGDELIRYDPDIRVEKKPQLPPLIRRVVIERDSVIFWGTASSADSLGEHRNNRIPHADNSILFEFAAPDYDQPSANQFQFFLEGIDKTWSGWTTVYRKEYTHLPGGDYLFRVRTRNIYGVVSDEASFGFEILPPWYRTRTAYLFFAGVFLFILYISRRFELKRIRKKQQQELELVELRKIKELDQLKSRFFANISHEFRTPLTLILGQVESAMNSGIDSKGKSRLQVAMRNARRLLGLINQLLDLSKLEAGRMELKTEQRNIVSFLKSMTFSFESLAEQKSITLIFEAQHENIPVYFEADKMEKVFYNLLSNAFNFTPEKGRIEVEVRTGIRTGETEKRGIGEEKNCVQLIVRDSGLGIPLNSCRTFSIAFIRQTVQKPGSMKAPVSAWRWSKN
jgi:signal transduction histidine kinase/ligand-binding sensor domain-containing protein